jgi:dTDP-4-dehydrorhamnose reductase
VAQVVEGILDRPRIEGIFHLGGGDRLSRYEMAAMVAARVGAPPELLRPGSMWDAQGPAPRGADCSLVSAEIRRALGIRPLGYEEALDLLVRQGFLANLQGGCEGMQ